jgi:hypothetical protein
MPYTAPTVNYSTTVGGTYTTLTGVQSVSIFRGRQYYQDPFSRSTCTVELIPANSYATPLAIGQYIDVRTTNIGTATCYFAGTITDVQRQYAIPYNSDTGAAPQDRILITATGGTGALGATQLTNYSLSATYVYLSTDTVASAAGVLRELTNNFTLYEPLIKNSAYTTTSSALDIMNYLLRTGQLYIDDSDTGRFSGIPTAVLVYGLSDNEFVRTGITFSDNGSGTYKYDGLSYLSSAQNTFSQITVQPTAYAQQTTNSGSAPYNSLLYSTVNDSTADALSLSKYLYGTLSGQLTPVPYQITTSTTVSASCMDLLSMRNRYYLSGTTSIGATASVVFRGTTATGLIQGVQGTFYPDKATLTTYLSPTLGGSFILNSSTFGVLNTNRLGYP